MLTLFKTSCNPTSANRRDTSGRARQNIFFSLTVEPFSPKLTDSVEVFFPFLDFHTPKTVKPSFC
jgi:hypothetical protein